MSARDSEGMKQTYLYVLLACLCNPVGAVRALVLSVRR